MSSPLSRLSPELKLILVSCRLAIAKDDQRRQRAQVACHQIVSASSLDWHTFLDLNARHKVQPLVYQGMQRAALAELMPAEVHHTLKEQVQYSVQATMAQVVELMRLHKMFDQAETFMLPLKGVVLSQRLFSKTSMRSPGDLDLFVQPAYLEQARQLLQEAGYKLITPDFSLTPRQQQCYLRTQQHYQYHHPQNQTHLEIHWKLSLEETYFDAESIQQMLTRHVSIPIGGVDLPCLSDNDLFLYLCLHGARHRWFRLKWLCDLSAFLQDPGQLNWSTLEEAAHRVGVLHVVKKSLALAHHFLDAPLPNGTLGFANSNLVHPPKASPILQDYANGLSMPWEDWVGMGKLNIAKINHFRDRLVLQRTIKHTWVALWQLMVEPNDWRDFPLPDWLFPFYFILRPFLWVWRHFPPFTIL